MDSVESNQAEPDSVSEIADSLSPKQIAKIVSAAKPASIVHVLQSQDFTEASSRIYAGFRAIPGSMSRPIVRDRLVLEASKNKDLLEALKNIASSQPSNQNQLKLAQDESAIQHDLETTDNKSIPGTQPSANRDEERLRDEVLQLKQELDKQRRLNRSLRDEALALQTENSRAVAHERQLVSELIRNTKEAETARNKIARIERSENRLRREAKILLSGRPDPEAIGSDSRQKQSGKTDEHPSRPDQSTGSSLWADATLRVMHRGEPETAFLIAAEVVILSPSDIEAAQIAIQCLLTTGQTQLAVPRIQSLCNVLAGTDNFTEYTKTVFQLVQLSAKESQYIAHLKHWSKAAAANRERDKSAILPSFIRISKDQPVRASQIQDMLRRATGQRDTWLTERPKQSVSVSEPVPKGHAYGLTTVTIKQIVDGIRSGDSALVAKVRKYVAGLQQHDRTLYDSFETSILDHVGQEAFLINPIWNEPIGPAVLDVSNVAWFDQENVVHGSPKLKSVVAVLRLLRQLGYFPVVAIADAPLPHTIDLRREFAELLSSREVVLVNKGTDADEEIVRSAKRLRAPVVTNDYMDDWDPNNDVVKLGFTITPDGRASLLR